MVVRLNRFLRDWSQEELAKQAGVHASEVYRWEAQIYAPSRANLERLAAAARAPLGLIEILAVFVLWLLWLGGARSVAANQAEEEQQKKLIHAAQEGVALEMAQPLRGLPRAERWERTPEDELLPTVRELGIGFVPYSPLGRGFLTGRFRSFDDLPADDYRRNQPRFQGANFQKNLDLVTLVEQMAADKRCTASQLALAWLLHQGDDIVPIPGTKRVKYLEENVAAIEVTLSDAELRRIDAIAPKGIAAGTRYPEAGMATVNR